MLPIMRTMMLITTLIVVLGLPTTAQATVCADYPNQAAAQRAADTRDADGDGIYCESLPCPCSTAAGGGGSSTPTHHEPAAAPTKPKVGPPVALGKRTKGSNCKVHGPLPDPACTPGSRFRDATPKLFCVSGYTSKVRHVTETTKNKVFAEYGIKTHSGATYEVDHLVPLELGGSNSIANLFPEAASPTPGFHQKDKLENKTHSRACAGQGDWRAMQRQIAKDWTKLAGDLGVSLSR
jgi:hypothetical protein